MYIERVSAFAGVFCSLTRCFFIFFTNPQEHYGAMETLQGLYTRKACISEGTANGSPVEASCSETLWLATLSRRDGERDANPRMLPARGDWTVASGQARFGLHQGDCVGFWALQLDGTRTNM